ncbi:MAG: type IV toxin-antitoxin system AbiEi family antitoxin domain-containing protein [Fimbriimonadales bacterium]
MRRTWDDVLELAKRRGVITPADVRALGLAPENLNKLAKLGKLEKLGRGLYRHPGFEATEHHSYVEVAKAVPDGVICLLSALNIHGIGTQMPWEVWVAIPRGRRIPATRQTRMRAVTMSGANFKLGTEEHTFEGVRVKVYGLEKTIIDCFRLRRLIGHEVAVEALRESIRAQKINVSTLTELADHLRSRRLIEPYLEAML